MTPTPPPPSPPLQLSPLIVCQWGSSLKSLDLSGCSFGGSSVLAEQAHRMTALKRAVLNHAKGDALLQVVRGGRGREGCA